MLQLTIWSFPSLAAIGLTLDALLRSSGKAGRVPGAGAMRALCCCVIVWSLGQLAGTLTTDLELKILASKLQYPGIALLPVTWLVFALTYVRRVDALGPRALTALLAVPAMTVVLAWSHPLHHLLWSDIRLSPAEGFVGMALDYGAWFDISVVYSYALVAAGTLILIYELSASPYHRRALVGVILAPAIVAALNLLHLSGYGPRFIDLTPLGFALGAIVLARGVLHTGLLKLSPALHRKVLEELADGVVILDAERRLVDVNAAARSMLGLRDGDAVAPAIETLLRGESLAGSDAAAGGSEVAVGGRSYDLRSTFISAAGAPDAGKTVLVFRDITERLQAEAALRQVKQEMEHLAHTDPLTDLPNRRYFMQRLREEEARLQRNGRDLSVILLDLDHFKEVNDTFGHETGDDVLRAVACIIRDCVRGCDVAARLGGEEFALLLPETSLEDARRAGERVRAAIEAYVVNHPQGCFRITASAGVATAGSRDRRDPLKRADQAMYRAKDSGRNAVCS